MAYRSQGQLAESARYCQQSLEIHQRVFGPDALGLIAHHNALSALSLAQGQPQAAYDAAHRTLDICKLHKQPRHPQAALAYHQLAMLYQRLGKLDEAENYLQKALQIQHEQNHFLSEAQTLNDLDVVAFQRRELNLAEQRFTAALKLQERLQARPQAHYSTLCNLAKIYDEQGHRDQAIALLEQAIELTEKPRAGTSGAEDERARFFSRFASAYEQLVDWNLQQGRVDAAFQVAERGRSRTLLDQLDIAGVDLRQTLTGPVGKQLLEQERTLRIRLNSLHARALLASGQVDGADKSRQLAEEIATVQREFSVAWTEIRNASPYYRQILSENRSLATQDEIRQQVLRQDAVLVFYSIGAEKSYVLGVTPRSKEVLVVPLEVTAADASLLAKSLPAEFTSSDAHRGLTEVVVSDKGEKLSSNLEPELISGPLKRKHLVQLVAHHLQLLRKKGLADIRGLVAEVESPKGEALQVRGAQSLGDVLVPTVLRQWITQQNAKRLVIVPDGALHQLPFESLVLNHVDGGKFLLDELPPIAYAPSANSLFRLVQRPAAPPEKTVQVLTVGNPSYDRILIDNPANNLQVATLAEGENLHRGSFLKGRLPMLPGTEQECQRIAQIFSAEKVKLLMGNEATERNVIQHIRGSHYVHLAAHGLVDEHTNNLFGAIALTPPNETESAHEDGFLSLGEIHVLGLSHCELAVLSACQTNVGPERPLEASTSLAQAFLTAGARRVVASYWNVSDESTAELMGLFFEQVAVQGRTGETVDYATALHQARQKIRAMPGRSSPYYWAPFVL